MIFLCVEAGGLLLSTLLRPDPEVEDLGFQELHRDKSPKNEKPAQCENQKVTEHSCNELYN